MKGEQWFYKLVNDSPNRHIFTFWLKANICTLYYSVLLTVYFYYSKEKHKKVIITLKLKLYFMSRVTHRCEDIR